MTRIAVSEARLQFADIVNKVESGGERILLHRHGKNVAAIVPIEDLRLIEDLENRIDRDTARAVWKEKAPRMRWTELKRNLGLPG